MRFKQLLIVIVLGHGISCQRTSEDTAYPDPEIITKTLAPSQLELVCTTKIFSEENRHSAFTDLVKYGNRYFLAFRNSDSHAFSENGKTILMSSKDLTEWEIIQTFSHSEFDLRDPKFALNNNLLELNIHGSHFDDSILTKIIDFRSYYHTDKDSWSDLTPFSVGDDPQTNEAWPWRITYLGDTAYTFGYVYNLVGKEDLMDLYISTDDGNYFSRVNQNPTNLEYRTGEGTIRVSNSGNFYCLIRQNKGKDALFGKSPNPITGWEWFYIKKPSLGGPNFLACDDTTFLIAGRDNSIRGVKSTFVGIYNLELDSLTFDLQLPSGGDDTGYPGLETTGDTLLVSYYSSHEGESSIYLSLIKMN